MSGLTESINAVPSFLVYFGLTLVLLASFMVIYARVTPYREFALIRQGNIAAAISLAGAILGFVLPLASAVAHSVSLMDMLAWSLLALGVQVVVYAVITRVVAHFREAIEAGVVAPALLLATTSVAVGILNAACLTY
jgi:putative membrane protein